MNYTLMFIVSILFGLGASTLVGFDCNTKIANVTTFSLYDDVVCHDIDDDIHGSEVNIQLVSIPNYDFIHVYECKVEIFRHIQQFSGGQWFVSHAVTPEHGYETYTHTLTKNECMDLHILQHFSYGTTLNVNNIKRNATSAYHVQLAGAWIDGSCSPAGYTDLHGSWSSVCVSGKITITLKDYTSKVNIKKNTLYLDTNSPCNINDITCLNIDGSQAFWKPYEYHECDANGYDVYYEGIAKRFEIKDTMNNHIRTYVVKTADQAFTLDTIKASSICNSLAYQTEHPKFYILENVKGAAKWMFKETSRKELNIDVFTYLNMKFTTYDKHMKSEFDSLYKHWKLSNCKQRRENYKFIRALARTSPESFAYHVIGMPGYTAYNFGELMHVAKCAPTNVELRRTAKCYLDLPITFNNRTAFLTPFNRLIVYNSTVISCSQSMPSGYRIGDRWISQSTYLKNKGVKPKQISTDIMSDWTYETADELVSNGIYTMPELERYNEHLVTLHSTQVKIIDDLPRIVPTLQMVNTHQMLLDDPTAIFSRYFKKAWAWWDWLSRNLAAIFGLYLLYRCCSILFGWCINARALYKKHGRSWKLLKAPSTKLTMYSVMTRKDRKPKTIVIDPESNPSSPDVEQVLVPVHSNNVCNIPTAPMYNFTPPPMLLNNGFYTLAQNGRREG